MRAKKENERVFTQEIGRLRVLSNELREEQNENIINWVDRVPLKDGREGRALTMVLPTKGCKYAMADHGGCSMCTLPMDNPLNPSEESIKALPQRTWKLFQEKGGINKFNSVKFYTSGSFLDRWELPMDIREEILATFASEVEEITIETRCEYVIKKHIESALKAVPPEKLVVAIGQETTDDEINRRSVNKAHKLSQFERAVNLLHNYNVQIKGYILLKSIFMSELSAADDALRSAKHMYDLGVQRISINPCYIGKKTLMEQLFKRGTYRPPWLWSVYFATIQIKRLVGSDVLVVADPVAAGKERGPRNCGKCDQELQGRLKDFSATQDLTILEGMQCSCLDIYKSAVMTEHLSNGMGITELFV